MGGGCRGFGPQSFDSFRVISRGFWEEQPKGGCTGFCYMIFYTPSPLAVSKSLSRAVKQGRDYGTMRDLPGVGCSCMVAEAFRLGMPQAQSNGHRPDLKHDTVRVNFTATL